MTDFNYSLPPKAVTNWAQPLASLGQVISQIPAQQEAERAKKQEEQMRAQEQQLNAYKLGDLADEHHTEQVASQALQQNGGDLEATASHLRAQGEWKAAGAIDKQADEDRKSKAQQIKDTAETTSNVLSNGAKMGRSVISQLPDAASEDYAPALQKAKDTYAQAIKPSLVKMYTQLDPALAATIPDEKDPNWLDSMGRFVDQGLSASEHAAAIAAHAKELSDNLANAKTSKEIADSYSRTIAQQLADINPSDPDAQAKRDAVFTYWQGQKAPGVDQAIVRFVPTGSADDSVNAAKSFLAGDKTPTIEGLLLQQKANDLKVPIEKLPRSAVMQVAQDAAQARSVAGEGPDKLGSPADLLKSYAKKVNKTVDQLTYDDKREALKGIDPATGMTTPQMVSAGNQATKQYDADLKKLNDERLFPGLTADQYDEKLQALQDTRDERIKNPAGWRPNPPAAQAAAPMQSPAGADRNQPMPPVVPPPQPPRPAPSMPAPPPQGPAGPPPAPPQARPMAGPPAGAPPAGPGPAMPPPQAPSSPMPPQGPGVPPVRPPQGPPPMAPQGPQMPPQQAPASRPAMPPGAGIPAAQLAPGGPAAGPTPVAPPPQAPGPSPAQVAAVREQARKILAQHGKPTTDQAISIFLSKPQNVQGVMQTLQSPQ